MARHDYVAFGEEIPDGSVNRNGNFKFTSNVTQGFTGQESDGGTAALDYYNARTYGVNVAGFLQPDPGNAGADLGNPQSWNGYGYVLGNPLGLVDPSGLESCMLSNNYCGLGHTFAAPGKVPSSELGVLNSSTNPFTSLDALQLATTPTGYADGYIYGNAGALVFTDTVVGGWVNPVGVPTTSILTPPKSGNPTNNATAPTVPTRMFGTHYCGPGGAGLPVNQLDMACQAHDACYDTHRLSVGSNFDVFLPSSQRQALKACNQSLCNAASKSNDLGSTRVVTYFVAVPLVGNCAVR